MSAGMEGDSGERNGVTPCPSANIQSLPHAVLLHIFSFLTPSDLCLTLPRVCSLWEELHQDPSLYCELSFNELDGIETVDKCMKLATALKTFSLVACDLRDLLSKISLNSVGNGIGIQLRSLSLRIHKKQNFSEEQQCLKINILPLLKNCSKLQTLHLNGFSCFSWAFFNYLCDPPGSPLVPLLQIRRLVENYHSRPFCFVTRFPELEEIQVYKNHYGVLTSNELKDLGLLLSDRIRVLRLDYGDWSPEALSSLQVCHCLQDLCLNQADKLSAKGLFAIGSLTGLRKLEITDCRQPTEESWVRMISSPALMSLESLVLNRCTITNETVVAIGANLCHLRTLSLARWRECGIYIPSNILYRGFESVIKGCPKLKELAFCDVGSESVEACLLIPDFLPRLQTLSIYPQPHNWICLRDQMEKMPDLRVDYGRPGDTFDN